jgi:hypothetical protein
MMKERESKEKLAEKSLTGIARLFGVLGCWVWGCERCHALPLRMDQRDEMVAPEDDDTADARLMAEVCVAAQSATPFRDTRCTG